MPVPPVNLPEVSRTLTHTDIYRQLGEKCLSACICVGLCVCVFVVSSGVRSTFSSVQKWQNSPAANSVCTQIMGRHYFNCIMTCRHEFFVYFTTLITSTSMYGGIVTQTLMCGFSVMVAFIVKWFDILVCFFLLCHFKLFISLLNWTECEEDYWPFTNNMLLIFLCLISFRIKSRLFH